MLFGKISRKLNISLDKNKIVSIITVRNRKIGAVRFEMTDSESEKDISMHSENICKKSAVFIVYKICRLLTILPVLNACWPQAGNRGLNEFVDTRAIASGG